MHHSTGTKGATSLKIVKNTQFQSLEEIAKTIVLDVIASNFLTSGISNHQHTDPTPEINISIITSICYVA